jgi:pimeloyl-ACP methyl ester carboxylesterase
MALPLVLIHGYSANDRSFEPWRKKLIEKRNLDPNSVFTVDYKTLANNVSINDIAEGFDRALREDIGLHESAAFDAVVHSTGMLVIRAWLARYAAMDRPRRLRHLIALAPATNGSPVAHKGRSWIGALVKGSKDWRGPDFMEAGEDVLKGLELASEFTWNLAERDLFGDGNTARFKQGKDSPYVFTFCGDTGLGVISDFATQAVGTKINGSDGVVRWAGAALNSRRLLIDFSRSMTRNGAGEAEFKASEWSNQDNKLILWPGMNHSTIMDKDIDKIIDLVCDAFHVNSDADYTMWTARAQQAAQKAANSRRRKARDWQQFVIRVRDELGAGVKDWSIGLSVQRKGARAAKAIKIDDLHPYGLDKSYRCLHVDLQEAGIDPASDLNQVEALSMELNLSTNSPYVLYEHPSRIESSSHRDDLTSVGDGLTSIKADLKPFLKPNQYNFILPMPNTTTFIEIIVNRSPSPKAEGRELCQVRSVHA